MTPEQAAVKSLEVLQQIEKHLKGGSSAVSGSLSAREVKTLKTETSSFGKQLKLTTDACKSFKSELYKTTEALHKFRLALGGASKEEIKSTIAAERAARKLAESQRKAAAAAGGADRAMGALGAKATGANKSVEKLGTKAGSTADTAADLGIKTGVLGFAFDALVDLIRGPVMRVLTDYMSLTERGVGGSLGTLYSNAMKAGMSLQEYVATLEENRAAVARAGSFDEFNRRIETTSKQLGELGVFGADARRLSANLQTSATVLGVPQKQLAASTSAQVKVFEDLRKSTMMTSEGFKQLINDFSANQNVQEALLGMAPEEREARRRQLLDTYKLGHTLGLTEEASSRLAQALMDQRRATARERFEAAGRARQLGAMTGMSTMETEELARLSQKKNLTTEEAERLNVLAGEAKARLETLKNSGSMAAEFAAEQLEALLPSQQRQMMEAAGVAKLQTDAGAVNNKNFGEATSGFAKAVGEFATSVTGFTKSPFYDVVKIFAGAVGSFVAVVAGGLFLKKMFGGGKDITDIASPASKVGKSGGIMSRAAQANSSAGPALLKTTEALIKSPITTLSKSFQLLGSSVKAVPSIETNLGSFGKSIFTFGAETAKTSLSFKSIGSSILGGLNGAFKSFAGIFRSGGPLGFVFSAIEEAFTGQMANALGLGDGVFGRILGVVIGGFNGIFTGVTRLFDGAINWILEGLGINFKVNTTKWFDFATSVLFDGFKMLGSIFLKLLANVIESIMGVFGIKAPFVKSLRETADDLDNSIAESSKNRDEMIKSNSTLREVGEKNIKAQEENAKKSEKLNTRISNNVAFGLEDLAAKAASTTKALQAEAAQTKPGTVQAAPAPETRSSVSTPEVNKEAKKAGEAEKTAEKRGAGKTLEADETVTISKQQLEVLKQIYEAIIAQNATTADMADSLVSELSKNPGRPYEVPRMISQIMAA